MATEENVNPTEGQEQENDYRETLLVRNPDSGQVEAVSKLVTKGDRREVHTVQPLAKNRPAFYPFRSSNAVAAFIRGFKSQKDNPIQFQKLKVDITRNEYNITYYSTYPYSVFTDDFDKEIIFPLWDTPSIEMS